MVIMKKFSVILRARRAQQLLQAAKFKILECNIVEKQAAYLTHNAIEPSVKQKCMIYS